MPSAVSYDLLRQAAEGARVWQSERPAARAVLADHDRGGLVDVLLDDKEPEAAWEVAIADPDWDAGERRWMRLTEAGEANHSGDALEVYSGWQTANSRRRVERRTRGQRESSSAPPVSRPAPTELPNSPITWGCCETGVGAVRR